MTGKETLLVTGASGFVGGHILRHAVQQGYAVTALSRGGNVKANGMIERVIQVDLSDREQVTKQLGDCKFDYVVNCAGYVDHSRYLTGGRGVIDTHLGGLMNLLGALDNRCIKRFVQIGSSDEYGANPAPQSEVMREDPISPYSFAKVAATHLLQMRSKTEDFPAVMVRLFLVYGPGQDSARFLPQVIRGCLRDESFPVSLGEQKRDFCYVDDVMEGIFKVLVDRGVEGKVVNLGSGRPVAIRDVIEKVAELAGGGRPQFGRVPYRPGENMSLYADVALAHELVKWHAKTDLDSGLARTIDWYRSLEA